MVGIQDSNSYCYPKTKKIAPNATWTSLTRLLSDHFAFITEQSPNFQTVAD